MSIEKVECPNCHNLCDPEDLMPCSICGVYGCEQCQEDCEEGIVCEDKEHCAINVETQMTDKLTLEALRDDNVLRGEIAKFRQATKCLALAMDKSVADDYQPMAFKMASALESAQQALASQRHTIIDEMVKPLMEAINLAVSCCGEADKETCRYRRGNDYAESVYWHTVLDSYDKAQSALSDALAAVESKLTSEEKETKPS